MKKIIKLAFLFFFVTIYSQNISDYQTIYIPKEFADSKINQYGLNDILANQLKLKKFLVHSDGLNFNCESLKAEISDNSSMFTNRVTIKFYDCHDKIVATLNGKSNIKEFKPGMRNATENAVQNIPFSNPIIKEKVLVAINEKPQREIETIISSEDLQNSSTKIYSNGKIALNKVELPNGGFALVDSKNTIPYAIFKNSTKKDIFRVKLSDGTFTLAYLENGKIVIEFMNSDGSLRTEIFEKK
jgi:hypothetical protein